MPLSPSDYYLLSFGIGALLVVIGIALVLMHKAENDDDEFD